MDSVLRDTSFNQIERLILRHAELGNTDVIVALSSQGGLLAMEATGELLKLMGLLMKNNGRVGIVRVIQSACAISEALESEVCELTMLNRRAAMVLRKSLPATFSINSSSQFCSDIRRQLETLQSVVSEWGELQPIRPLPWYFLNLAWHSNYSCMQLRKNQTLERFHEFLKLENEVGNITRQEVVHMGAGNVEKVATSWVLSAEESPQLMFDIVFRQKKNISGGVHFTGYKYLCSEESHFEIEDTPPTRAPTLVDKGNAKMDGTEVAMKSSKSE
ncbi:hypothetical protein ACFX14_007773 [Malus domestica]